VTRLPPPKLQRSGLPDVSHGCGAQDRPVAGIGEGDPAALGADLGLNVTQESYRLAVSLDLRLVVVAAAVLAPVVAAFATAGPARLTDTMRPDAANSEVTHDMSARLPIEGQTPTVRPARVNHDREPLAVRRVSYAVTESPGHRVPRDHLRPAGVIFLVSGDKSIGSDIRRMLR
jgi:hypothetical protein